MREERRHPCYGRPDSQRQIFMSLVFGGHQFVAKPKTVEALIEAGLIYRDAFGNLALSERGRLEWDAYAKWCAEFRPRQLAKPPPF